MATATPGSDPSPTPPNPPTPPTKQVVLSPTSMRPHWLLFVESYRFETRRKAFLCLVLTWAICCHVGFLELLQSNSSQFLYVDPIPRSRQPPCLNGPRVPPRGEVHVAAILIPSRVHKNLLMALVVTAMVARPCAFPALSIRPPAKRGIVVAEVVLLLTERGHLRSPSL